MNNFDINDQKMNDLKMNDFNINNVNDFNMSNIKMNNINVREVQVNLEFDTNEIEKLKNKCKKYLEKLNVLNFEICYVKKSYVSGLSFQEVKPKQFYFYTCLPEIDNKYDSNAIGVFTMNKERIGYIPRQDCMELRNQSLNSSQNGKMDDIILLCWCHGPITERSAQCRYIVIKVFPFESPFNSSSYNINNKGNNEINNKGINEINNKGINEINNERINKNQNKVKLDPCQHVVEYELIQNAKCPLCDSLINSIEKV